MLELLKKSLFSTRLMAVLFLVFATSMAFGTFIESWYSTETARIWIYNTWWFEAIMVFFVINFIGNMFRYRLFRWEKWPVLVLHLSWIIIILGAFVTRYISFEGMMPIREGKTENIFYSDKTYLTAFVDGEINGEPRRKVLEDDLIVTPEALKSNLPWKSDYDSQEFTIEYVDFINGAEEGLIPDENGNEYLKIVEAGDGQRHEHYLESGKVTSIHNVLFALNKATDGAINIFTTDSVYQIKSPFEGSFMRMADQFKGQVIKDSLQEFQLRSLYSTAGMQFVIPDPVLRGTNGILKVPSDRMTEATADALVIAISSNGETVEKKLLGGKGQIGKFSEKFMVGGLDFMLRFGPKEYELPFQIKLNDFIAEKYPGTEAGYASFMSKVTVEDERPFDYDIFMNNVLDHKGYRFFQSGFDPDEKGTNLSVNHDQWGTNITYIGYFLLYAGLLGIMFFGKTRFRDLTSSLDKLAQKKKALTTILIVAITLGVSAQEHSADDGHDHTSVAPLQENSTTDGNDPEAAVPVEEHSANDGHDHSTAPTQHQIDSLLEKTMVSKEHAAKFGKLIIQDEGGRMKPINTFSSELLRKLSRSDKFNGMNADQVFLSMMMSPALWYNNEFIILDKRAKNDSIRQVLGIPKGQMYIKATDFFDENAGYKLEPVLRQATATNNPTKFESDVKDANIRMGLLDQALQGSIVKIFPLLNDENNKWISALEYRGGQYQVPDSLYGNFIKNALPYYLTQVQKGIQTGDYAEADKMLAAFEQNQKNNGGEVMPSKRKVATEVVYNKLNIFNHLYRLYALIGLVMFFVLIFQIFRDRSIWRMAVYFLKGCIIILFLWHTAGLALRWYISGHAPWSNAYESILYVAWATMAIGLALGRKSNMTIAASAFVVSMLLMIANWNWVDPTIGTLVPVLDSYWLMIHVSVIVGSYGPLTVAMILGLTSLILIMLTTKKNKARMELNLKELTIINEIALTTGLVMLTIGNFLGGQWANESWGRYWGWDPKETWALISIMVYAFVIHTRLVPGLRGKWTFNFLSVVAFYSILMTYFGVNYYLVGLHSYGQSGGAAITPDYVWYIAVATIILGALSFWRYRVNYVK